MMILVTLNMPNAAEKCREPSWKYQRIVKEFHIDWRVESGHRGMCVCVCLSVCLCICMYLCVQRQTPKSRAETGSSSATTALQVQSSRAVITVVKIVH